MNRTEKENIIREEIARKDLTFGCKIKTIINSDYGNKYEYKEYKTSVLQNNYNLNKLVFIDCFGDEHTVEDWIEIYDKLYENDDMGYKQKMYDIEILGHEMTLEDILLRADKNKMQIEFIYRGIWFYSDYLKKKIYIKRKLGKAISEQESDTVDELYDLIQLVKGDE